MNNQRLTELLQEKIYEDIPLTQYMGVKVVEYAEHKLILSAPIENNINHRKTVFGGSITSLSTLACWGLIYLELYQKGLKSRIVIQKGETNYSKPTSGDFQAICSIDESSRFERFTMILKRKGIARIQLFASIVCNDELTSRFLGSFVAEISR